jgi:dephospho-CoA kinase
MNLVANDLRKTNGPSYIAEELYKKALEEGGNGVIESIRNLGEAQFLKSHNAVLVAIDADKKIRYDRAVVRNSATDHVSFEEFCLQEDREMAQTALYDMNVFGVMKLSDIILLNNGTLEDLHRQIDSALQNFTPVSFSSRS